MFYVACTLPCCLRCSGTLRLQQWHERKDIWIRQQWCVPSGAPINALLSIDSAMLSARGMSLHNFTVKIGVPYIMLYLANGDPSNQRVAAIWCWINLCQGQKPLSISWQMVFDRSHRLVHRMGSSEVDRLIFFWTWWKLADGPILNAIDSMSKQMDRANSVKHCPKKLQKNLGFCYEVFSPSFLSILGAIHGKPESAFLSLEEPSQ